LKCAPKPRKTLENQGFFRWVPYRGTKMAGALGLEPRTNGFGVAPKTRKPLEILAFSNAFQSIKTQNAML